MTRPKPIPCPACGSKKSKVIDCRDAPRSVRDQLRWTGGTGYWRRRACVDCGRTFTTEETVRALDEEIPPSDPAEPVNILR